jgi:hypothetical protein
MGRVRLGSLPKTRRWNQVVSLIAGRGDVEGIAAASATAAETDSSGHRKTRAWRTPFGC